MIGFLQGVVIAKKNGAVILDVRGVGYRVVVTETTLERCEGAMGLHIYTHVREQEMTLYGFIAQTEQEMFELLISVSGIGPKAAMNILNVADVATLQAAIAREDTTILTSVSGIGTKTAKKVIMELSGKVVAPEAEASRDVAMHADAIEALRSMGYSVAEARIAVEGVDTDVADVGECVRLALKNLGRK